MMEPYQRASENIRAGEEAPLRYMKNLGLTALGGAGATAGARAFGKLVPAIGAMINPYVPDNIARAGLSKIDPRFAKFIKGAEERGYQFPEIRSLIQEKLDKSIEPDPKDTRNIIEQYDPELHTYINEKIGSGANFLAAGKKALGHERFKKAIGKMTKDLNATWDSILEHVYGAKKAQESPSQQPPDVSQVMPQATEAAMPQGGPGNQALMAILSQINQTLGKP